MSKQKLRIGLPKGSLQDSTLGLMEKAGFRFTTVERSYYLNCDDEEIEARLVRAQEMAPYVQNGHFDAGITGLDWIQESGCDVLEVCELLYSKETSNPTRWVLAVPNESPVTRPEELEGGIVATELIGVTSRYFREKNIDVKVEFSWGATEVKARLVNAIVELTETGTSLRANNLRVLDTVIVSTTRLIANRQAWQDRFKREKIENVAILLQAAIAARGKVGMKMNVRRADLDAILKILPAEKSPTISGLADAEYVAIEVIVDDHVERSLVPALKRAGASGIITYPLNKVIH